MVYDVNKIAEAIKKAIIAGDALKDTDDGGTCNFDAAYISVPGIRETTVKQIEALTGARLWLRTTRWQGRMLVLSNTLGQGACRTAMAEAQCKALVAEGIDAHMYYAMD